MKVFWETFRRELKSIRANPRGLIVLFCTPLFFLTLFGYLYSNHVVNHIPTVVLDYNNTSISRTVINAFDNSDKFEILGTVASEQEMQQFIEAGKAQAAIILPHDLNRQIKKQRTTPVMLVINGSNLVISNSLLTSATEVLTTVSVGTSVKVLEGKGLLPDTAKNAANLLSLRPRVWYNPTFNYNNFMLIGLLGATVQQVIFLYSSVSIVNEKKSDLVARLALSFRDITAYVLGKVTPYVVVNLFTLNLTLYWIVQRFEVPFRGQLLPLVLLELAFVGGVAALGVFLSIISGNALDATQTAMLISVPSFLISGYTWPLLAMPGPLQVVAKLLPLTHFVNALREVILMGVGMNVVMDDIQAMALLAVIFIPLSVLTLRLHVLRIHRTANPAESPISF